MDDAIRTVQRLVFGEAALYGGVLRRLLRDGGSIVTFCRRLLPYSRRAAELPPVNPLTFFAYLALLPRKYSVNQPFKPRPLTQSATSLWLTPLEKR